MGSQSVLRGVALKMAGSIRSHKYDGCFRSCEFYDTVVEQSDLFCLLTLASDSNDWLPSHAFGLPPFVFMSWYSHVSGSY